MGKKIAVLQSNYIPWKGYFDIISSVDEFIIYDVVQYTKNDWRNRNIIKTNSGLKWITIPVYHNLSLRVDEVKVANNQWRKKHWNTIRLNYTKAKYFKDYRNLFEELYLAHEEIYLSEINYLFITTINKLTGISTRLRWASEFELKGDKSQKLIEICKQSGASEYYSGPSAQNYIDLNLFEKEGIKTCWIDYSNYPQYSQLFPPFEHGVSILDLLFNEGPDSTKYMKSFI